SKTVVATRLYNAFGETVSETGTWPDEVPFGYQSNWLALDGMTLPDGTRLYLSPTRVYHPGVGRFLQRDLLGTWQGMNLYSYVAGLPVSAVDPLGLFGGGWGGVGGFNYYDWRYRREEQIRADIQRQEAARLARLQGRFDTMACIAGEIVRRLDAKGSPIYSESSEWRMNWSRFVERPAHYFIAHYSGAEEWRVKPGMFWWGRGSNWGALLPFVGSWIRPMIYEQVLYDSWSLGNTGKWWEKGVKPIPYVSSLNILMHEPQHDISQQWIGHEPAGRNWQEGIVSYLDQSVALLKEMPVEASGGQPGAGTANAWKEIICKCTTGSPDRAQYVQTSTQWLARNPLPRAGYEYPYHGSLTLPPGRIWYGL
ncbi:MAG: RHS repeat-associated core domain-containing protein, partial [Planctomycetota bacterium]